MRRTEAIVSVALLTLVFYTLALSVLASVQTSTTISNSGTVAGVGVGVYWDLDCIDPVSSIGWGILDPGESKNVICYIRNEGNLAANLTMYTSDWNPPSASQNMAFNWDYGGQVINPDEVIQVTFTLSISASIEDVTSFSFDVTVVGST